jgi:hypothetical protein
VLFQRFWFVSSLRQFSIRVRFSPYPQQALNVQLRAC